MTASHRRTGADPTSGIGTRRALGPHETNKIRYPAPLELWQAEWCPSSHRVRQRLTELGLSFLARQVPAEPEASLELTKATGHSTIPVLVAGDDVVAGEQAIATYLNTHVAEPLTAEQQRSRAAQMKREELEQACPELAAATC